MLKWAIAAMAFAVCAMGCSQPSDVGNPYKPTYKFTENVIQLPAGTDGTKGTAGTYVLFGDWPQSEAKKTVQKLQSFFMRKIIF